MEEMLFKMKELSDLQCIKDDFKPHQPANTLDKKMLELVVGEKNVPYLKMKTVMETIRHDQEAHKLAVHSFLESNLGESLVKKVLKGEAKDVLAKQT